MAAVELGFWPVATGLLLAAACLALGWRLGHRGARTPTEALFNRAEGQLWEAVVERRGDRYDWDFSKRRSWLHARLFGAGDAIDAQHPWRDAVLPEQEAMDARSRRALSEGLDGYTQEFPVEKGGRRRWLQEHVSIRRIGEGRWSLVGVLTDITPLREAQERLHERDRLVVQTLARADCLLWRASVRIEGGSTRWSDFDMPTSALYRRLFGDRVIASAGNLWSPEEVPSLPEMTVRSTQAIVSGAGGYEQEFQVVVAGSRFWLREQVTIAPAAPGEFRLVGVIVDVTDLRRSTSALAAEKERLAVTLAAMAEAVVTTDRGGRVLFANRAAGQILSLDSSTMVGRPAAEVCRFTNNQAEPVPLALDEVIRNDSLTAIPAHVSISPEAGRRVAIEGAIAPVHDQDGAVAGVVIVFRDVTERVRLDQEIARASKLQSVGALAGGIAHDFNNLLAVIVGNVAVAKHALPPEGEPVACLAEAENAALRAKELTQRLLTFAQGGDPVCAVVQLADVIAEAAASAARGTGARCELDVARDLRLVEADQAQIAQVMRSLVLNAAQSMPGGGVVRIEARNESLARAAAPLEDGDYVRISVIDAGCGIPAENLGRIFDPFFTTKAHGSGMGLATAFSIVRKHRGSIDASSKPGIGSTFRVYLPVARRAGAERPAVPAVPPARLRGRILLMDDEEPIRKMCGRLLSRLGLAVETAADGIEAVALFKSAIADGRPFDVVMLDLTVPGGMGGLEAFRAMRAIDPGVRGIVSSGYSIDMGIGDYRACGFAGMIAKPYRVDDCARTLAEVLAHPRDPA